MKILKFTEFSSIFEEEIPLPAMPSDMSMDGEAAPAAPAVGQKYKIIFITAEKEWSAEYPTGGGIKKYKHYEIKSEDLDKWITDSNLGEAIEEIKNGLTGKGEMSKDHFFKLKQALRDKTLEYKELAEVEVEFDGEGVPYTDNLDVTFLKPTKSDDDNA
jgi:hypothetical protein